MKNGKLYEFKKYFEKIHIDTIIDLTNYSPKLKTEFKDCLKKLGMDYIRDWKSIIEDKDSDLKVFPSKLVNLLNFIVEEDLKSFIKVTKTPKSWVFMMVHGKLHFCINENHDLIVQEFDGFNQLFIFKNGICTSSGDII